MNSLDQGKNHKIDSYHQFFLLLISRTKLFRPLINYLSYYPEELCMECEVCGKTFKDVMKKHKGKHICKECYLEVVEE